MGGRVVLKALITLCRIRPKTNQFQIAGNIILHERFIAKYLSEANIVNHREASIVQLRKKLHIRP